MLTPEEHAKLLRSFEVDRLLKLVTLEAKRLHNGHYTILAFTTGYKVAFGTPNIYPLNDGQAFYQVQHMPGFPTLKEALIAALVTGKDFEDYFDGDGEAMFREELLLRAIPGDAMQPTPPLSHATSYTGGRP
jgi:hypothetical protein